MSEMLSSGGLLIATSFEMSPVVLFALAALEEAALPKKDIVGRSQKLGGGWNVDTDEMGGQVGLKI